MVQVFTQGKRPADFILTEANGQRSRENGVLASGQKVQSGQLVQKRLDGKFIAKDGTLDSGGILHTPVAGISIYPVDATDADQPFSYIARDAEVNALQLVYPAESSNGGEKAGSNASLATLGIIARE